MKFTLTFNCDNAAFEDDPVLEISRILLDTAQELEHRELRNTKIVKDVNGNTVGYWGFTPGEVR